MSGSSQNTLPREILPSPGPTASSAVNVHEVLTPPKDPIGHCVRANERSSPNHDAAAAAYSYFQHPRPVVSISPTPHSQAAALLIPKMRASPIPRVGAPCPYPFSPSPTPPPPGPGYNPWAFLQASSTFGGVVQPRFDSTVIPQVGAPYPYPFTHVRVNNVHSTYPIQTVPSFNHKPNHPSVIEEQLAAQMQVYTLNNHEALSNSTFSPSSTPFPGHVYNPWTFLKASRAFGGVVRPRFDSTATLSIQSSPSHQPVSLPFPTCRIKRRQASAGLRVQSTNEIVFDDGAGWVADDEDEKDDSSDLESLGCPQKRVPSPERTSPSYHMPASKAQIRRSKILPVNTAARSAYITGDLSVAEEVFTQEIDADANNYTSYANRSLVMARKYDWDHALEDAIMSITIQPSLIGYISKGIALCGKGHIRDARTAFDLAFIFTDEDTKAVHFLLLVKSIAMFNANQREEAMMLVQQLAAVCPNNDTFACRAVEAYLCVRLGIDALNGARHDEAADHFTAAINSSAFSAKSGNHSIYEDLAVLFGWDLEPLWQIAHMTRCHSLLRAGRLEEALESYRYMMNTSDETTKASCLDWSTAFKQECSDLCFGNGNAALAASDYDRAIDLYSVVIDLNFANDTIYAHRSIAKSGKMLWEDALLDAQKVIELNPSSHVGYELKHAALHGAQRYDEAIEAVKVMISRLDSATDMQARKLREQYVSPSDAEGVIQQVIDVQLDTAPLRLLNTTTGLLCDREAQTSIFRMSIEYKELQSSIIKHANLRKERITEVVATYFRCAMLSHRWEGKEPLLQDIQDKIVYKINSLGGIVKLRTFCEIARDAGYRWAWSDTCCIDKSNNVELQASLNSMFVWYRHSALTVVYLPDVPPSSKSGALANSEWNRRGWTFQEFLASKVVLFYQNDWSLYLNDHSPNHKESATIMKELEDATGIDAQALVSFRPGMRGAREKLQWASKRITTLQEDIAYSLFGIFGVHLPVIYGEKKQNALGRLLQEIVARSGDISSLDWIGQSSEFNSCLPADITSYTAPSRAPLSLSENDFQAAVSTLQDSVTVGLALKLYTRLDNMSAPRFANCRLRLPCIAFRVTEIRRKRETHLTYGIKADGLHNLLITTKDTLTQFTSAKPTPQAFLLVRAWDRRLLELPDFAEQPAFTDDVTSVGDWSEHESLLDQPPGISPALQELADSESRSRALQLIVRLGQPFSAFLLAQQRGGEYRRVASDHDIIAQVKDVASVHSMMDIRTLEIL